MMGAHDDGLVEKAADALNDTGVYPTPGEFVYQHQERLARAVLNAVGDDLRADAAEQRAEEAEFHVEQLRDARTRAERRIEAVEALLERWERKADALHRTAHDHGDMGAEWEAGAVTQHARELRVTLDDLPTPPPPNCGDCEGWL